jgi:E3 ubiquitin-protein ligase MARCH6
MAFWFGDAGWARTHELEAAWPIIRSTKIDNQTLYSQFAHYRATGAKATENSLSNSTSNSTNITSDAPFLYKLFRSLIFNISLGGGNAELELAMGRNVTYGPDIDPLILQKHSSLLSGFTVLWDLTSSVTVNRLMMDILEGQIITSSIVWAFILVFLIREWVIQQQPVPEIVVDINDDVQQRPVEVDEPEGEPEPDAENEPAEAEPLDDLRMVDLPPYHGENLVVLDEMEEANQTDSSSSDVSVNTPVSGSSGPIRLEDTLAASDSPVTHPEGVATLGSKATGNDSTSRLTVVDDTSSLVAEPGSSASPTEARSESERSTHSNAEYESIDPSRTLEHNTTVETQAQKEGQNLPAYLYGWFWGDIVPLQEIQAPSEQGNDEHVVNELDVDEPFVPFVGGEPVLPGQAQQAGLDDEEGPAEDAEAADDAEDLEGILELIGMQGNIFGLFQNALFSGLLITATFLWGLFFPYMLGKTALIFIGNIHLIWEFPLLMLSTVVDFVADIFLFVGGYIFSWVNVGKVFQSLPGIIGVYKSTNLTTAGQLSQSPKGFAERAGARLVDSLVTLSSLSDPSLLLAASIQSHEALIELQDNINKAVNTTAEFLISVGAANHNMTIISGSQFFLSEVPSALWSHFVNQCNMMLTSLFEMLTSLRENGSITIPMPMPHRTHVPLMVDPNAIIAYWSAKDRLASILLGYAVFVLLATAYVRSLAPLTVSYRSMELKAVEIIKQAGGVCKVIFIISIEMIVFPLFCGFLLDFALLPLFEYSTTASRIAFTVSSPWTSGFVHWFVGTCYMFHFALFVSMCRKIMRPGVLYFIRDPDDPNFHPVRDVLERSVLVQLRKIAFSAIVYGTLIVVCLGGVVWGLWAISDTVLPLHWTSSQSALEFPIDILFYNFLTPVVVRFAKPADGLHAMYKWWFRTCAKTLRLSNFLFNDEAPDEEGHHIRTSWKAWFFGKKGDTQNPGLPSDDKAEVPEVYFQADGNYARVPAVDQIRIPKGSPVFVEVDQDNNRLDKRPEEGVHAKSSNLVTKVYIPPWFKLRISLFVLAVWLFAAATGIAVTILPLLFGRMLLSKLEREGSRSNDIYAFSLGVYILGAALYLALHSVQIYTYLSGHVRRLSPSIQTTKRVIMRTASVVYVYGAFAVGFPLLIAFLLELYILLPLHTYFGNGRTHVVHLVQGWTLGFLYVRIFTRILFANEDSVPSRILRAVIRPAPSAATGGPGGYLNPDARLATRAFIAPSLLVFSILVLWPFASAKLAIAVAGERFDDSQKLFAVRMAYPGLMFAACCAWFCFGVMKATARWRMKIKDEVYLIGERLHNFGEKRATKEGKMRAAA